MNGNLIPGIHRIEKNEIETVLGFSPRRRKLLVGLKLALKHLRDCGCGKVYIDGSFASNCEYPNDFDICFDVAGIDWEKLYRNYPEFLFPQNKRAAQKKKYMGEFFPSNIIGKQPHTTYLELFQQDKTDGSRKGIIEIIL